MAINTTDKYTVEYMPDDSYDFVLNPNFISPVQAAANAAASRRSSAPAPAPAPAPVQQAVTVVPSPVAPFTEDVDLGVDTGDSSRDIVSEGKDWRDYAVSDLNLGDMMSEYTNEDSPTMIAARTQAMRDQQSRGLLNTQGTLSAIQNNQALSALEPAKVDMNTALTRLNNDLERDLLDANLSSTERSLYSKIWGDMVNTQLASMGAVMGNSKVEWTQKMQDNFEDSIGASRDFMSSIFKIPLS